MIPKIETRVVESGYNNKKNNFNQQQQFLIG